MRVWFALALLTVATAAHAVDIGETVYAKAKVSAQRFADAFAGCGEWIEPEPRRRRSESGAPFDGARVAAIPSGTRYARSTQQDRYRPAA